MKQKTIKFFVKTITVTFKNLLKKIGKAMEDKT